MAVEGFQYVALHSFTKDQEEDLDLQPGDLLTVSKASLLSMDNYSEGCEEQPEHLGWLLGYNERSKQRGDFPGTYVKFVGSMKMALPSIQPRSQRPLPAAPRPDSSQGRIFFYLTCKNLVIFKNLSMRKILLNSALIEMNIWILLLCIYLPSLHFCVCVRVCVHIQQINWNNFGART